MLRATFCISVPVALIFTASLILVLIVLNRSYASKAKGLNILKYFAVVIKSILYLTWLLHRHAQYTSFGNFSILANTVSASTQTLVLTSSGMLFAEIFKTHNITTSFRIYTCKWCLFERVSSVSWWFQSLSWGLRCLRFDPYKWISVAFGCQ